MKATIWCHICRQTSDLWRLVPQEMTNWIVFSADLGTFDSSPNCESVFFLPEARPKDWRKPGHKFSFGAEQMQFHAPLCRSVFLLIVSNTRATITMYCSLEGAQLAGPNLNASPNWAPQTVLEVQVVSVPLWPLANCRAGHHFGQFQPKAKRQRGQKRRAQMSRKWTGSAEEWQRVAKSGRKERSFGLLGSFGLLDFCICES